MPTPHSSQNAKDGKAPVPRGRTRQTAGKDSPQIDIAAFHAGDARVIEDIVIRHTTPLVWLASSLTRTQDDADDLLQNTWLRMFTKRATYRGGSMHYWLGTIMRHVYLNTVRGTKRRLRLETNAFLEEATFQDSSATEAFAEEWAEERLAQEERAGNQLWDAVLTLPPGESKVVALRVFCDLSVREVATLLGRSEGTVKATLFHAMQRLRKQLPDDSELSRGRTKASRRGRRGDAGRTKGTGG